MKTQTEALRMALEIIQDYVDEYGPHDKDSGAQYTITTIKEVLAQPEQEPVAWMSEHRFDELRKGFAVMTTLTKQRAFDDDVAIYTTPPQRTWVGLTDEEVNELVEHTECEDYYGLVEATEAKLKEKNT